MLWNASWAHAGEPCSNLVHTYRALNDGDDTSPSFGVMDRHYLKVRTHNAHIMAFYSLKKTLILRCTALKTGMPALAARR